MGRRVAGKIALVTGAAGGLGRADALRLAEEGATVTATDINSDGGYLEQHGVTFLEQDVREEQQWQSLVADIVAQHGQLDVLVNNAGVIHVGDPVNFDLTEWRHMNAVNVEGTMLGCKYALPAMIDSGGGSIINLSSVAARSGLYFYGGYCATKGAIAAYTKSVAVYCAQNKLNIRCNSIHPGGIETPINDGLAVELGERLSNMRLPPNSPVSPGAPQMRLGEPDDIAHLVVYLASDESKYMSGSELFVDNTATITAAVVE